jgi:hypothetical protein
MKKGFMGICLTFMTLVGFAQTKQDSVHSPLMISGNIGTTNNGISIVPTFSLGQPAFNTSFSVSKGGRFSLDPELRLTFDGKKGSAMVWFRYKLINSGKFRFNIGMHPALNFAIRSVTENGKTWKITQARRFIATELSPYFVVNKNFTVGMYYLKGTGLQDDGPVNMHFVTLNTNINNIPLFNNFKLGLSPQVYYLKVDKQDGYYLTGNIVLTKTNSPFGLMSTMNKEINTNIAGSKNFDWNITLMYRFSANYYRSK